MKTSDPQHIYIGSYSDSLPQPSIYDLVTKDMTALKIKTPLTNPSYILIHKSFIYIVQQTNSGRLTIMSSKTYQILKSLPTSGNDPCHIRINQSSTLVVVTNYSSGSFIMYHIQDNLPSKLACFVMHEGSSLNPDRQASSHPHCSIFVQNDSILFINDLGTDTVYWYTVNKDIIGDALICQKDKCLKMIGCGPRHFAKGQPDQKILYITGQLDSSIRILSYASNKLQLLSAYRISNNPTNYPSQILYRSNTVYMATRGDNFLIIFDVASIGILKQRFRFKVGQWPRHFNITPTGTIYVACQLENIVERYKYENNKIYQLGSLKISAPSCINFQL